MPRVQCERARFDVVVAVGARVDVELERKVREKRQRRCRQQITPQSLRDARIHHKFISQTVNGSEEHEGPSIRTRATYKKYSQAIK